MKKKKALIELGVIILIMGIGYFLLKSLDLKYQLMLFSSTLFLIVRIAVVYFFFNKDVDQPAVKEIEQLSKKEIEVLKENNPLGFFILEGKFVSILSESASRGERAQSATEELIKMWNQPIIPKHSPSVNLSVYLVKSGEKVYASQVIEISDKTLEILVEQSDKGTLYIDSEDPEKYYIDLDAFLQKVSNKTNVTVL